MDKLNKLKTKTKEMKHEVDEEIVKTDLYQTVMAQTMGGEYEISEKDAHKHALAVCFKSFSNSLKD